MMTSHENMGSRIGSWITTLVKGLPRGRYAAMTAASNRVSLRHGGFGVGVALGLRFSRAFNQDRRASEAMDSWRAPETGAQL